MKTKRKPVKGWVNVAKTGDTGNIFTSRKVAKRQRALAHACYRCIVYVIEVDRKRERLIKRLVEASNLVMDRGGIDAFYEAAFNLTNYEQEKKK